MTVHRRAALSARLDTLRGEQNAILASATIASLNDGRYDAVTRSYYLTPRKFTGGTRYSEMSKFYARRDAMIASNVARAAHRFRGQRMVVVTGADHRGSVVDRLKIMSGIVQLVPVS